MARTRYVVFVKLWSGNWLEHLTFFQRDEAESYAAALRACYPGVMQCLVRPRETGFSAALTRKCDS